MVASVFENRKEALADARAREPLGLQLPFGEELFAGMGGRTQRKATARAMERQHFTSKKRDNETGLDYFGARYYSSAQGRLTSADPLLSSGTVETPQSWNRYSYPVNHPLELIDPDGLYVFDSSVSDKQKKKFNEALAHARASLWKIASTYGVKSHEYKEGARALNAYGAEGVNNGVMIKATASSNPPGFTQVAGVAGQRTADNPTGQDIRITFRSGI